MCHSWVRIPWVTRGIVNVLGDPPPPPPPPQKKGSVNEIHGQFCDAYTGFTFEEKDIILSLYKGILSILGIDVKY